MTGACFNANYIYIIGKNTSGNPVVARFTPTGTVSSYMTAFPGLGSTFYDIASHPSGGFWIARDNADSPVIAYNTSGAIVGFVESSVVSAAMGLTIDTEGHLWVSNPDNNTIYELDVTTGISEDQTSSIEPRALSASANPFTSSVLIVGNGFNNASIEVFDIFGRSVESAPFQGSFLWNAHAVAPGIYFARVSDSSGSLVTRLVKAAGE